MYLSSSVVEHFLPSGVQGVPVCQETLLCHVDHLSGSRVHGHGPLIPEGCLLGLLLGLDQGQRLCMSKSGEKFPPYFIINRYGTSKKGQTKYSA